MSFDRGSHVAVGFDQQAADIFLAYIDIFFKNRYAPESMWIYIYVHIKKIKEKNETKKSNE